MTDMTRRWTPEEDEILRRHYLTMGPTALSMSGMIDRTIRAMRDRSGVLKIRTGQPSGKRKKIEKPASEPIGAVSSIWQLAANQEQA